MRKNAITTESYIERASIKHDNRYRYDNLVYIHPKTKVKIICEKHGEFLQLPMNHLNGYGCRNCENKGRLSNTQEFIEKAIFIHDDKYNYSESNYTYNNNKIIIICPKHGIFEQFPNDHLKGRGCNRCGIEAQTLKARINKQCFVDKAISIHGNKYSYENSEYLNAKTKIEIICKEHGSFCQTPSTHTQGRGCTHCKGGFGKRDFIKKCKSNIATFYILRLFNKEENFIKIGITGQTIEKRFEKLQKYKIKTICSVVDTPDKIWGLELEIKRKLKNFSYIPGIKFGGYTECYDLSCMTEVETLMHDDNRFKHAKRSYNTE